MRFYRKLKCYLFGHVWVLSMRLKTVENGEEHFGLRTPAWVCRRCHSWKEKQ